MGTSKLPGQPEKILPRGITYEGLVSHPGREAVLQTDNKIILKSLCYLSPNGSIIVQKMSGLVYLLGKVRGSEVIKAKKDIYVYTICNKSDGTY